MKQRCPSPTQGISPPPLKRRRLSPSTPRYGSTSVLPSPPSTASQSKVPSATTQTLRIYSWNINGLQPFLPPATRPITEFLTSTSKPKAPPHGPSIRANLSRWGWPHLVFLQEVKIAPKDTKIPDQFCTAVNSLNETVDSHLLERQLYDAHFCLPRDKHNATGFGGKVYGVCTLIRKDLVPNATVKTVDWDMEGRVQVVELPSSGLILFNTYAVNGTINDYRDPNTGKVVGNRHDRKKAFHSLLANEVQSYEEKGWHVIIAGDINISRTHADSFPQLRMGTDHVTNRADFEEKFMRGLGMLDTFRLLHGEKRKYSYRPTNKPWGAGGDRVDMMLATKGLKDAVKEADILDSEMERGPSDHVPLCLKVELVDRDLEKGHNSALMDTISNG